MKLDPNYNCSQYGRRATPGRHAASWNIEGEYVSMRDIAARLGVDVKRAQERMRRARAKGAVTWASLGLGSAT